MNIAEEIARQLDTDAGVGTFGTDIFIGTLNYDIANGISVVEIGSGNSNKSYALFEQNLEIWVRNVSASNARAKIKEVYDYLQRKGNFTTVNAYVYYVHSSTDIQDAGRDADDRQLYKAVFTVTFREVIS